MIWNKVLSLNLKTQPQISFYLIFRYLPSLFNQKYGNTFSSSFSIFTLIFLYKFLSLSFFIFLLFACLILFFCGSTFITFRYIFQCLLCFFFFCFFCCFLPSYKYAMKNVRYIFRLLSGGSIKARMYVCVSVSEFNACQSYFVYELSKKKKKIL